MAEDLVDVGPPYGLVSRAELLEAVRAAEARRAVAPWPRCPTCGAKASRLGGETWCRPCGWYIRPSG